MPCYSRWDEYMDKTSPSYFGAKRQVEAKLESVKLIFEYYYAAAGMNVPTDSSLPPATRAIPAEPVKRQSI